MGQQGIEITEGTLIRATLKGSDLGPAFRSEYYALGGRDKRILCWKGEWDSEEGDELICELMDEINSFIPVEGYYFGSHPGDASDFGYWKEEEKFVRGKRSN